MPVKRVMALIKGEERYCWIFHEEDRDRVLQHLGRFASDPRLSLTWYDAAVLAMKVRKGCELELCRGRIK